MSFGRSFKTRPEAKRYMKAQTLKGNHVEIRKLKKKLFPRRTKLYHVGTWLDFLNFA